MVTGADPTDPEPPCQVCRYFLTSEYLEICVATIRSKEYHSVFVAMKIMSAHLSRSARVWTLSYSLFLSQAVGLLAADLVSQEVPDPTPPPIRKTSAFVS